MTRLKGEQGSDSCTAVHAVRGEQEAAGEQGQRKSCMCWEQAQGGEVAEGRKAATAVHALER